jgi:ADP-heptose:LPS heptosyltransferase
MNYDQMKLVDYAVGGLLCAAIGWVRHLFVSIDPARKVAALPPRTIVVLKFLGMGSILQAAGTIEALRARFPGARVILVTAPANRAFGALLPCFDEILTVELSSPFRLLHDLVATVLTLRRRPIDLLVDLEFFSNFTGFLTALLGGTWTIGVATPKSFRNWIYCEVISFDHGRHISEIFYKVARALGMPPLTTPGAGLLARLLAQKSLKMDLESKEKQLLEKLSKVGWRPEKPTLVVNINAGPLNLNRRWPLENFRSLIVTVREPVQVVLIGAPSEAPYVAGLVASLKEQPGLFDLAGQLDVGELILLLSRANLFVGNDSGPLHIAQSCQTRTISFFGPETPRLYGPVGPSHIVFYKELSCSPCLNVYNQKSSDCRDNRCLKEITVDEVVRELEAALAGCYPRTYIPPDVVQGEGRC